MRSNKHVASAAAGFGIIAVGVAIWTGPAASAMGSGPAVDTRQVLHAYANLPLAFVENQGQTDPRVRYYAQDNRRAFYLTREEIVLSLVKEETRGLALALRFLGSNPRAVLEGEERAPGEVNYLRGNDPARWQTRAPALRAGRVSRALAGRGPAVARSGRSAEVRVPGAAGSQARGYPAGLRRRGRPDDWTTPARCSSRPRWACCATHRRCPTR